MFYPCFCLVFSAYYVNKINLIILCYGQTKQTLSTTQKQFKTKPKSNKLNKLKTKSTRFLHIGKQTLWFITLSLCISQRFNNLDSACPLIFACMVFSNCDLWRKKILSFFTMYFFLILSSHNQTLVRLTEENYKTFEKHIMTYIFSRLVLLH